MKAPAESTSGEPATTGISYDIIRRSGFLDGSYRGRYEDPENLLETGGRFMELVRANPFATDDDPVQLIARSGDRIVGRSGLLVGQLQAGGSRIPILWGSGLRVSPEFRRRGIAQKLVELRMGLHHTIGGCGPARTTTNLYRKLGWTEFRMPRCLMILKSNAILRRFVGGPLPVILAPVCDVLFSAHRAFIKFRSRRILAGFRLEVVEEFPESLAAELEESETAPGVRGVRTVESINLLLRLGNSAIQRCVLIHRGERVVGFVIVRAAFHETLSSLKLRNFSMGSVKDWRSFDPAAIDEYKLMLVGVTQLMTMKADAIEATPALEETARRLRKLGMFTKDALKLFLHVSGDSPLLSNPALADAANWRFTAAEGDNFFL
jgi:GNAT superfamily N-acetyltransferase